MVKIIATFALMLASQITFSQTKNLTEGNLKNLHKTEIGVQTNMMFKAEEGKVISLQISKNEQLKEHVTTVPALLVCVSGKGNYEDEKGRKILMKSGDFVKIEANVKHWVSAFKNSNFLLIK
ncbi:cupin domain-containing protein [Frigoriflavimonas asaccharolytica]|uniref:Quercetin dioxygenase-like cupin family protein n=1 Tax=Frigoriflavimonas asaccharolytica TaxID=2735899 RepID=A0A8J8KAC6_9FLAO|nr:hypothetical protein [Frigoriflavimonas asaccharolytica]NRS91339.1 quercetin dioxygenase-like cupin family protein [Frigoriflavimonas asaccharolytica]